MKKAQFDELFDCYTSPKETKFGLIAPIKTELRRSNLQKEDINEIILTGGMSTFYFVHEALNNFFGDVPIKAFIA